MVENGPKTGPGMEQLVPTRGTANAIQPAVHASPTPDREVRRRRNGDGPTLAFGAGTRTTL